jgi:altronate dehydratase small subunit
MTECFQIDKADNVATLLQDAEPGAVLVRGESEIREIHLVQPIKIGHKVALRTIPAGTPIVKYGITIGEATRPITAGEWVHLHNCRSLYDAKSSKLDVETGSREETPYV